MTPRQRRRPPTCSACRWCSGTYGSGTRRSSPRRRVSRVVSAAGRRLPRSRRPELCQRGSIFGTRRARSGVGPLPRAGCVRSDPATGGGAPSGTSRTTTSSAVMISGRRRPGRCCSRDPTVKTERFRRPCPGWACPLGATGRRTVSVRTPTAHATTLAGRWQRFAGMANARRPCGDLRPASVPRSRRIRIVVNRPIP